MPPITAQDDVKEVYQLLRRPGQGELSWQDVLASLARQYTKRNKQFQLSDKNWFLRPKELRPAERDEPLNADDYSVPVKVTVRSVDADQDGLWYPVPMVNFDDFELQRAEGAAVVSIYGSPPRIAYSGDITDRVFTLWYEPSATKPKLMQDTPEIEQDFNTLLVYDTALECGQINRDKSDEYKEWWPDQRVYLATQVDQWETIMTKWMNMSRQQGRAYKRTYPLRGGGSSRQLPGPGGTYYT